MPKLKQFAAILGLVCTVGIAASTAPASAGQFDGVTVRIGTFGGKWRDIVDSYVAKAFEQEGGKIEYVLGQPANNMAKLIAARGHEPPFDLFETMDNFLPQLAAGNFTEPLDLTQVPNLRELDKSMYDSGKVMIWITQEGVIYNQKKFAEAGIPAPKRYQDLADPRLKGKVSLPDISAGGAIPAIVGMSYEGGGSEADIGPGLDLVKKIAPANFWSSSSNLQTMLVNGDVWAAAAQAGNVQRLRGKVDLAIVFPPVAQGKGGVLKQGYLVKIKGAKNHQGAGVDHQPVPVAAHAGRGIDRGRTGTGAQGRARRAAGQSRILLPASVGGGLRQDVQRRFQQGERGSLCPAMEPYHRPVRRIRRRSRCRRSCWKGSSGATATCWRSPRSTWRCTTASS